MASVLKSVRMATIGTPLPTLFGPLPPRSTLAETLPQMESLWDGLSYLAESDTHWADFMTRIGRLIELAIKSHLVDLGVPRRLLLGDKGTLGALNRRLRSTRSSDLERNTMVVQALSRFTQLRNISSHGVLSVEQMSEERSTYGSVLTVWIVLALARDTEEKRLHPSRIGAQPASPLASKLAEARGPTSFGKLVAELRDDPRIDVGEIAVAIAENFPRLLALCQSSTPKQVGRLAVTLGTIDASLANCVVMILPHDRDLLEDLAGGAQNTLVKYLYLLKRADADLYNRALSRDANAYLLDHLRLLVRDRGTRISNVANLINNLPPRSRVRAIQREGDALVSWAGDALPSDSVALIVSGLRPMPSGLQVDSRTRLFLDKLVPQIASQCDSITRSALTAVPNRLRQLHVMELDVTTPVVLALINRLYEGNVVDQVCQRLIW